jgi:hypothetical protein
MQLSDIQEICKLALKDYRFHVKIQPNHFEWSLWITSNADTGIQTHNYRKDPLIKPLHFCPPFNSRRWTLHILPEFTAHLTQRPACCWADLNDQHLACSQGDYNQKLLAKWARTSQIPWMLTQHTRETTCEFRRLIRDDHRMTSTKNTHRRPLDAGW